MRRLLVAAILTGLLALPLPAAVYYGPSPDADHASLTSGFPNEDGVSATFWVYVVANRNDGGSDSDGFMSLTSATPGAIWDVFYRGSTARFGVKNNVDGNTGSLAVSLSTWYFIGFRKSGTNYNVYVNGSTTADVTHTSTETTGAASRLQFGGFNATLQRCDCRIAAVKMWNAYMTPEEFQNEMRTYRPKRTTSLYMWEPMFLYVSPLVDFSGTAHSLTGSGSPTTADGPPISW